MAQIIAPKYDGRVDSPTISLWDKILVADKANLGPNNIPLMPLLRGDEHINESDLSNKTNVKKNRSDMQGNDTPMRPPRPKPVKCSDYKDRGLNASQVPPQCRTESSAKKQFKITTQKSKTDSSPVNQKQNEILQAGFENKYMLYGAVAIALLGMGYAIYR